jgi:monoamine oxidase
VTGDLDLIVVGAGAAGLAAAKTARAAGASVVLLEASNRTGGRAYTRTTASGYPWDAGAHWLHHAEVNPFTALADDLGRSYLTRFNGFRIHGRHGLLSEEEHADWLAWSDAAFAGAHALGATGRDVAASRAVEDHPRWRPLFDTWYAAMVGVPPEMESTLDYARSAESENNWPLADGYGALVQAWAADVPVELSMPVTRIDTRGRTVTIETPKGVLSAKAVVVALPLGVLQRGLVAFAPDLPAEVGEALHGLHPGYANKVAVELDKALMADFPETSYLSFEEGRQTIRFQLNSFGRPLAVGYLADRFAAEIEAEGPDAMIAFARERLVRAFGSDAARRIGSVQTTDWLHNPLSLGAYSCALPGCAEARTTVQQPVSDRLFLAGEYVHTELYGCVDGARESGERAARQALAAVGISRPERRPASVPSA